jgi:uncharacterized membrane protein YqhA
VTFSRRAWFIFAVVMALIGLVALFVLVFVMPTQVEVIDSFGEITRK